MRGVPKKEMSSISTRDYEFVIVGSGIGGGPLAANLSLEGFEVLLIEAGADEINDHYSVVSKMHITKMAVRC